MSRSLSGAIVARSALDIDSLFAFNPDRDVLDYLVALDAALFRWRVAAALFWFGLTAGM